MTTFGLSFLPAEPLSGAEARLVAERVRELCAEAELAVAIERGRCDLLAELALRYGDDDPHQRAA